jgi:hypothetical protein
LQAGHVELGEIWAADIHAANFLFDGAKADLQKTVSINPIFQVSHSFTLGSTLGGPSASAGTYNFQAIRGTDSVGGWYAAIIR